MKRFLVKTLICGLAIIPMVASAFWDAPVAHGTLQDAYQDNLAQQQKLKDQISAAKGQEQSLANEIATMDDQISLNELQIDSINNQIQQTQDQLDATNGSIDNLSTKLDRLNGTIVQMQQVADERVKQSYIQSRTPKISLFVVANSFREALMNFQYMKELENQDNKILSQIDLNRKSYSAQKTSLEDLKTQKETLRDQLASQQSQLQATQNDLNSTKAARSHVLAVTKNNEDTYQRLLAQQQAELNNILSAMNGGGTGRVHLGYVHRGDIIGYEGATGCATGSHLHFGLWQPWEKGNSYNGFVDPGPYLRDGELGKPEPDYPNNVTQPFGYNAITGLYGPGGHNGIDMADGYGSPIRAARDGDAWLTHDGGCPSFGFGTANGHGIIIYHSDGSQTWYWHLSSP